MDSKNTEQKNNITPKEESVTIGGSEYVRERVKSRPLNRRKLLRRTILTICMAILFGLVACLTLTLIEPIVNNMINPEKKPATVSFPEEVDEISPEDMYYDNEEMEGDDEQAKALLEAMEQTAKEVNEAANNRDYLVDYSNTYTSLKTLALEIRKGMVKIAVRHDGTDIFNNDYKSVNETCGVCVANNGPELLVLTRYESVKDADAIIVKLYDGSACPAKVKQNDSVTGLCIISIETNRLKKATLSGLIIPPLGKSNNFNLIGTPVFALGSPAGVNNSFMYGVVTSVGNEIETPDSEYKIVTTDIYGSKDAFGILVDMTGSIVGIINQQFAPESCENLITALGISELKYTFERMSNAKEQAALGIYGTDLDLDMLSEGIAQLEETTGKVIESLRTGVYVSDIEMDSPAMNAGIQRGDIIVALEGHVVENMHDYVIALGNLSPGFVTKINVMRFGSDGFTPIEFEIELGEQN